jgi:hypothetical protein
MHNLKAAIKALTYSEMMKFVEFIHSFDTPHETADSLLEFCNDDLDDATTDAPVSVDAGPVPILDAGDRDLLDYRDGKCSLYAAFVWEDTKQGHEYWSALSGTPYADLPDEPRAIIDAWCAELERK